MNIYSYTPYRFHFFNEIFVSIGSIHADVICVHVHLYAKLPIHIYMNNNIKQSNIHTYTNRITNIVHDRDEGDVRGYFAWSVGTRLHQTFWFGLCGLQEGTHSPPKVFCLLVIAVLQGQ